MRFRGLFRCDSEGYLDVILGLFRCDSEGYLDVIQRVI